MSRLRLDATGPKLEAMSYLGAPGRNPEQNEQIVEEQHRIEREHVVEARLADQSRPSWWQRFIRSLKRETPTSED